MTINCDNLCDCLHNSGSYNSPEMFRFTVLKLLCGILGSSIFTYEGDLAVAITGLLKLEDEAHTSGDAGVLALTRRIDTAASSANASGDYSTINTDSLGKLWVRSSSKRRNSVITPTVTAAATNYTAGDCIGGKMAVPSAFTSTEGTLKRIVMADEGAEAQDVDVVVFNADPSASTFTDNAACAIADADLLKIVDVISIRNHYAFSDAGASVAATDTPIYAAGTGFWAVAIARGAGYLYDATDALTFIFDVESD